MSTQTTNVEPLLRAAAASGRLELSGRSLKRLPVNIDVDLSDTVAADLSRNKLGEVPEECALLLSLERLSLYHNLIKSVPDALVHLQCLQFLDISRNQLSYLPYCVCELRSLQSLVVHNNRLVSLPEELGLLHNLMELDASSNEITHLPVQIGDLNRLRTLNLRHNHLQEVPVELSYLQLTTLDLSGNRISALPTELRFVISVCTTLSLGENPLTCPPANICSRGKVHVFKYLETQALKEDRKRGILNTESELYRKNISNNNNGTTLPATRSVGKQLSEIRFGNNDVRRKRHTADSGYCSEQAPNGRWSRDFNQEISRSQCEDARRIMLRSTNTKRKPTEEKPSLSSPSTSTTTGTISTTMTPASSCSSDQSDLVEPSDLRNNSNAATMKYSSSSTGLPDSNRKLIKPTGSVPSFVTGNTLGRVTQESPYGLKTRKQPDVPPITTTGVAETSDSVDSGRGPSPDDAEREERRRTAQTLIGQQLSNPQLSMTMRYSSTHPSSTIGTLRRHQTTGRSKMRSRLPSDENKAISKGRHTQPLPLPVDQPVSSRPLPTLQQTASSMLPVPKTNVVKPNNSSRIAYREQQQRSTNPVVIRHIPIEQLDNKSDVFRTDTTTDDTNKNVQRHRARHVDVKTMQKEAVLSFVKQKQSMGASESDLLHNIVNGSTTTATTTPSPLTSKLKTANNFGPKAASTSSIPQPMTSSSNMTFGNTNKADAHIQQLKMHIENRLRITLPDDLAGSLQDGVVLCHVVNHIRPRAVPTIHVPSPSVPKLNSAKCRRNVDNFLLACRRIGVREDMMCSPTDVLEPRKAGTVRLAITVAEVIKVSQLLHIASQHHHKTNNGHVA